METIVVASKNKGKLKEIKEIMSDLPFNIISMHDAGIEADIEENGKTFEENAFIKASEILKLTGKAVLADDSGLEVDCLNGAPGIYSARFAGEGATDSDNLNKLLGMLQGVPAEERTARFVCAAIVLFPDGRKIQARGTCEGVITDKPEGKNGFGYDPIFYYPPEGKTIAMMTDEEKNSISHRGKAMREIARILAGEK